MAESPSYEASLELFELLAGVAPDAHWQALLCIATASNQTWALFGPYLQMDERRVDLEGLAQSYPGLSASQARLVGLALNLYQGYGGADMAALAQDLDRPHWLAVLRALEIYRAGLGE
jgi:hypothetical protein